MERLLLQSSAHFQRSFGWGILVLIDSLTGEAPGLDGQPFAAAEHGLTLSVRHAQDVDAEVLEALGPDDDIPHVQVEVHLTVAVEPQQSADYQCVLSAPSGTLEIGDGDRLDRLQLAPGLWRAQITTVPADFPTQVTLVLSPAGSPARP